MAPDPRPQGEAARQRRQAGQRYPAPRPASWGSAAATTAIHLHVAAPAEPRQPPQHRAP